MTGRRIAPLVLAAVIVAGVLVGYHNVRATQRFDEAFRALADDLQARILKAMQEKDTAPELFTYLSQTAKARADALPAPSQDFQIVLKQRLVAFLEGVVKLNASDPLSAQANTTLDKMYVELESMKRAQAEAAGYEKPYF